MNWLKRNWHHLLFFGTMAGVVVLTYVLVGVGLDPAWQAKLTKFPDAIGALIGPFFGLVALMFGALYNAKITRDRDDRQREQEKCALAAALSAEFDVLGNGMRILRAQIARQHAYGEAAPVALWKPPTEIFKNNTNRLGLLGTRMTRDVTNVSELARIFSDSVVINWSDISTDQDLAESMKKKTYELANEAKTISIQLELIAGGDDVDAVLNTLTPAVVSQMQADIDHPTDTEGAAAEPAEG